LNGVPAQEVTVMKTAMRQRMRRTLAELACGEAQSASARACERLWEVLPCIAADGWREAGVMLYAPFAGELNIGPFAERLLAEGVTVYLPVVQGVGLCPTPIERWSVVKEYPGPGPYEPAGGKGKGHGVGGTPRVVVVPGLAFDPRGGRLGRGKGFYDRYIATARGRVVFIGVAFDEQIVETVPREAHDSLVHAVVTPSWLLRS